MLIKVSASRFTGKPGKTDRQKSDGPACAGPSAEKSRPRKTPPSGSRPTRFFPLRCPHAFRAPHVVSATKGCAPPAKPAVLPGISPNIAGPPERTPGIIETQRQRMARAFRISPTLRLWRALQERRTPLDPQPVCPKNDARHARFSASARMPTLPSTEASLRETRRACNTPDAPAKNA